MKKKEKEKEKEKLKNYLYQNDENYQKLKNETDDLRTQKTIKIILKNNLLNERDILESLIKEYKFQNIIEKIKTNRKRKQLEILNIIKYKIIKDENERIIKEYKFETENLINLEKKKIELLQLELNYLKFNDDEYDEYQNILDEYKKENITIIKKKIHLISKERNKLNKSREKSEIKVRNFENSINKEISDKRNKLRNFSNQKLSVKNNLLNKYNNINTINNLINNF